jgi:hypothetical protein
MRVVPPIGENRHRPKRLRVKGKTILAASQASFPGWSSPRCRDSAVWSLSRGRAWYFRDFSLGLPPRHEVLFQSKNRG